MSKASGVPAELVVLLSGRRAGMLRQDSAGRLSFAYEAGWKDEDGAYSLSLSMPMARGAHADDRVRPFLEGLLPDDLARLKQLGETFHVSAGNPFALLAHIGEDCAGAVQFVRPERLEEVLDCPSDEVTRDLVSICASSAGLFRAPLLVRMVGSRGRGDQ